MNDPELRAAVERLRDANMRKRYYEPQYVAVVHVSSNERLGTDEIELASTLEIFDAAGTYVPDPVTRVLDRANEQLKELIADGKVALCDVANISVCRFASQTVTDQDIRDAERARGLPDNY